MIRKTTSTWVVYFKYTILAFAMENCILSYFIISKNYFMNYTIPFYNTSNIPIFIFLFYSLKEYILPTKII